MAKNKLIRNSILGIFLIAVAFTTACKKNNSSNIAPPATRDQLTKDSIYLYAQQTYFWNVGMPSLQAFNPRGYATNDDEVMTGIRKLSSNGGKDKYSFIDDGTVATEIGGVAGDYGFSANYDLQNQLRVKYVYGTSPAALAGLKRGYIITMVNGKGTNRASQSDIDNLNDGIFGNNPSISLTVVKTDGTSQSLTINRASYNINPVIYTNTYTIGTKKVGYIVFNSFTGNSLPQLDAAFATFAANGVTELIVDLRYNGGGAVSTSEQFANLIAPSSQNGNVMFTYYFNQTMQDGKATILQNQKFTGTDGKIHSYFDFDYKPTVAAGNQEVFAKRGSLEGINRVYFLVTGGTASASELLINNLKPVVDVKLVGQQTYGKPVGFFSIHIDKSDLYIPQFQTKNQLSSGEYFGGFTPDKVVSDDITKEFGDPTEGMLSQALYYSQNGRFTSYVNDNAISSTTPMSRAETANLNEKLDHSFKGMVDDRELKFKK